MSYFERMVNKKNHSTKISYFEPAFSDIFASSEASVLNRVGLVCLVGQTRASFSWVKLVGHSRGSNSWVILLGQTRGSFSWVKRVGHSPGSNSWVILVG